MTSSGDRFLDVGRARLQKTRRMGIESSLSELVSDYPETDGSSVEGMGCPVQCCAARGLSRLYWSGGADFGVPRLVYTSLPGTHRISEQDLSSEWSF